MNPKQAEKDLLEISENTELIKEYNEYWSSIAAKTDEDVFNRYVFSFLSVHTSWSSNVRAYLLLKENKDAFYDSNALTKLIKEGGVQYYNTKATGLYKFHSDFLFNPTFFDPTLYNQDYRDRIMSYCHGLGLAKTAFAFEMCNPLENQTVCVDTHILQLYGYEDAIERGRAGSSPKKYKEIEDHWLATCKTLNIAPTIARAIWWDKKQKQKNSRYWTYVIE
jgi:thermostable 8-oxoguanine DNA glycosylase